MYVRLYNFPANVPLIPADIRIASTAYVRSNSLQVWLTRRETFDHLSVDINEAVDNSWNPRYEA